MPGPDKSSKHARKTGPVITEENQPRWPPFPREASRVLATEPREPFKDVTCIDSISKLLLEIVGEGIMCLDLRGIITFANPAAARITGWPVEELAGKSQHQMLHHSHPDGSLYLEEDCPFLAALNDGRVHQADEETLWRRDGTSITATCTNTPILIEGEVAGSVFVFRDISDRMRRDQWQRSKNNVFRAITSSQPLEGTLQILADAFAAYQPGCGVAIYLCSADGHSGLSMVAGATLSEAFLAQMRTIAAEKKTSACAYAASSGEEIFCDHTGAGGLSYLEPTLDGIDHCMALPMSSAGGQVLGVVFFSVAEDVAGSPVMAEHSTCFLDGQRDSLRGVRDMAQIAVEHRKLHFDLLHQAQHDRLTGLPNWLLLEDRLTQFLRTADRINKRVGICSIDLDRFRRVNENFGHIVGDALLRQVAGRFLGVLREIDTLGRQGGDEFIVLLPELDSAADADLVARRLLLTTQEPFLVEGHTITLSANIGISIYPDHARTTELLIQHADTALDFAKTKGQAKLKVFRPDLGERVRQLAARESSLRTAIEKNELFLMYQPLYDPNRQIHGFEALVRWQSPEYGLVPPDHFIPLAEETGLILPIGDWVLREACRQAMSWNSPNLAQTKIFVNISGLQLGQADFTQNVAYALRVSGLPPSRLELEVTESYIVPSFKKATARLQPLQDLGVSIAIDDFGTGHSSFSVLHKLPINAIKVDRSFISRIDKDTTGLSTVRAIVNLAHQLGMKTVAEGVETEAQFKLLSEMECNFFQGYLLSKPLSVDAVKLLFAPSAKPAAEVPVDLKRSA